MSPTPAPLPEPVTRAEYQTLVARVDAVVGRVAGLERRETRRTHRRVIRDRELLLIIAAVIDRTAFTAAQLLEHADHDDRLRRALGRMDAQQVGSRLGRLADQTIDGIRLERTLRVADGWIWAIKAV